jgi:acetolactate synthase-1/3 small subunit
VLSGGFDVDNDRDRGIPVSAPRRSSKPAVQHHLLSVLVDNTAGVLARVASLFSRRGYNIFSLAVAPTDDPAFSRITIVVDVASTPLEQIISQLDKLVSVVQISELAPSAALEAELLLASVMVLPERRGELIELARLFGGRIVDVGATTLTVALAGAPEDLDHFTELAVAHGIVELQRTGRIALPRCERSASVGAPRAAAKR